MYLFSLLSVTIQQESVTGGSASESEKEAASSSSSESEEEESEEEKVHYLLAIRCRRNVNLIHNSSFSTTVLWELLQVSKFKVFAFYRSFFYPHWSRKQAKHT